MPNWCANSLKLVATTPDSEKKLAEIVQELARLGVGRVVEVGPGAVLGGLVRRIDKGIEVHSVSDPASLDKTLAALGA